MKSLSSLVIAASALAVSITTLAQDGNRPVTRADMHGQVGQAEQQGTLHQSQIHHPPDQRPPPRHDRIRSLHLWIDAIEYWTASWYRNKHLLPPLGFLRDAEFRAGSMVRNIGEVIDCVHRRLSDA
jgi:hypothetical protein